MLKLRNQRGVSLIAAIFIIVILAFMGVIFVTLIGTGSFTSVNDLQSARALASAEGGVEHEQRMMAQNVDWYRSSLDPVYTTTSTLGGGSFTAYTNIPATELQRRLRNTDVVATVYTTNRFTPPASGILQIGDDIAAGAEYVRYTGTTATTFTGLLRGQTVGTITGAAASTFPRGTNVYPVTTLAVGLPANCNSVNIIVAQHLKFLTAGTLDIKGEEILYTGSSTAGGNMTLTGVQRCQGGTGPVSANVGDPLTPVLFNGATANNEAEIISAGTVGAAVRAVKKTIHR